VRAGTLSTRTAIHTTTETTGRRTDDINALLVLILDFEGRNKPPAIFLDVSQMLVSAKDGSLLVAAQFSGAHAASFRTIDFDKIGFGLRVRDCHIKGMARANAAPADEGKIFFRFGNNFLLFVQIAKVGFGNAAEEFLHPSPTIMADFH
jgi:hypothetical protein